MADGLLELKVEGIRGNALHTRILKGGDLKSRKGVNFPTLNLRLPSLTEKDAEDLDFGIAQDVDIISLSFVRTADDIRSLKSRISSRGALKPVIAKIEKPQALENLDEILDVAHGVMVARGDLGVEMSPEKVPMLQKHIIEHCNRRSLPVITATQMLESMIKEPRPTRAEASDVANAIIDGTDAVMLSGESAVGAYPVQAVEMMVRIAAEVESAIEFKSYPPWGDTTTHGLSKAVKALAETIHPKWIVVVAATAAPALSVAAERLQAQVVALTTRESIYHALNMVWGIKPLLVQETPATFEGILALAESTLRKRLSAGRGDKCLVVAGVPSDETSFIHVHTVF
jgi:pyruvate kinase